jgi:heavy metal sensor kinase
MVIVLGVYAAAVFVVVARSASHGLDEQVRSDFRWAVEMWQQKPDGTLTWFEDAAAHAEGPWLTVWTDDGKILYQTTLAELYPIEDPARMRAAPGGDIARIDAHGMTFRALSGLSTIRGRTVVIQVARSEAGMRLELRELLVVLALGLPVALIVTGAAGYVMARHALTPVDRLSERARSITAERLGDRLPVGNARDEFGRLAAVFNETLGRLESAFADVRQFTSNVSHELRTPLTAMRTVGEVGLREHRDEHAYRDIIGSMLEETDRLTGLIERLLALSRLESGRGRLALEPIDVGDLVAGVIGQLGILAEEKSQTIETFTIGRPWGLGDRTLLTQALTNVLDNAIKYTPEGGRIDVRMSSMPTETLIDVTDTGPGVPHAGEGRIFERFQRGASADTTTGTGLGLSIAKWAVEASGGQLKLQQTGTGGCTFRLSLRPASAAASEKPSTEPASITRLLHA